MVLRHNISKEKDQRCFDLWKKKTMEKGTEYHRNIWKKGAVSQVFHFCLDKYIFSLVTFEHTLL